MFLCCIERLLLVALVNYDEMSLLQAPNHYSIQKEEFFMADHLDAPGLMSPDSNPKTDITDIYAFQKPGDPGKSILVFNVNPLAPTLATAFESNGLYELKIDTDGDARAEIA